MLHKCLLAIAITFKGPLSLTIHDVPRIEAQLPITTDKIIHFLSRSDGEKSQNFPLTVACVAVVSVSFKPSGASARGHLAKRSKTKVGAGGRGGEGKETPAAEPRHFTERPQMASLPWGLHCHVKCHMRTNHF